MNRRLQQVARTLVAEAAGQCPGCGRIDRRLGDHRCEEPLTVAEARERMNRDGGLLRRAMDGEHPDAILDELLAVGDSFDRLTESIRLGRRAMRALSEHFQREFAAPASGPVGPVGAIGSYKGIPLVEDPEMEGDTFFAVSKPRSVYDPPTRDYFNDMRQAFAATRPPPITTITGLSA